MADEITAGSGMTTIQKIVIPELTRGKNFDQIADDNGIPVTDVVREWRDYLANRNRMSPDEQYQLHLLRLENLLNMVTAYAESTNGRDSDAVKNILGLLDQVEKLQNLNKSRLEEARANMEILSEKQMQMIFRAMVAMKGYIDQRHAEALSHNRIVDIRKHMNTDKDDWFYTAAQNALETIKEDDVVNEA